MGLGRGNTTSLSPDPALDTGRRGQLHANKSASPGTQSPPTVNMDSQPPGEWDRNFHSWSHPGLGVLFQPPPLTNTHVCVSSYHKAGVPWQPRGYRSGIVTAAAQVTVGMRLPCLARELPHASGASKKIKNKNDYKAYCNKLRSLDPKENHTD